MWEHTSYVAKHFLGSERVVQRHYNTFVGTFPPFCSKGHSQAGAFVLLRPESTWSSPTSLSKQCHHPCDSCIVSFVR